jgi:hypothetical protein
MFPIWTKKVQTKSTDEKNGGLGWKSDIHFITCVAWATFVQIPWGVMGGIKGITRTASCNQQSKICNQFKTRRGEAC